MVIKLYIYSLLFVAISACTTQTKSADKNIAQQKIKNTLKSCKNGDIMLRSGTGIISNMIRKTLNEKNPFTHCGVICKNKDSTYVIHAVAKEISGHDGIQTTTINDFLKNSDKNNVALFRLKVSKNQIRNMVNKLQFYLKKQINFDYNFDLNDSNKMYCSEIIYYSLDEKIRNQIFKLKKIKKNNILLFSTFYVKENFLEIKI